MPTIAKTGYHPPWPLRNGHLQSILPTLLRRAAPAAYRREQLETKDGDLLELDWAERGCARLAILSHGLEGHSRRSYVLGMVRALRLQGWDALAWNFRACGGQPNRLLRFYHSGAWSDLEQVVRHACTRGRYRRIDLIGFSVGGNITLLYLGQQQQPIAPQVRRAVVFSVPCDLASSARQLEKPANRIYMRYFLRSLHAKIQAKMPLYPAVLDDRDFGAIRTFRQFDTRYTAPLNGFADAASYWRLCSSRPVLPAIRVPTLMVSAADDPFLPPACYPFAEAESNPALTLEVPRHGGHVGFMEINPSGFYWSERRALEFLAAD